MEAATLSDNSVRFENFELDLRTHELYRNGKRLKIRGHPVDVLAILVEHPGELVTRETLQKRIWPSDTFLDFEHSLNNSVGKLRDALGDRADRPRFIETLPRLGYRFVALAHNGSSQQEPPLKTITVDTGASEDAESRGDAQETTKTVVAEAQCERSHSRKPLWILVAAAGVVLACTLGLAWFALRPLPMPRITSYRQIASVGQWARVAGTDGGKLYIDLFLPNGIGVVPLSGGRVVPISLDLPTSQDSPASSPVILRVSPDGSRLVVAGDLDPATGRELWVIDPHGGGARYLAKGLAPDWSPDGSEVLYPTQHGDLYVIPSEGGESRLLLASPVPSGTPSTLSGVVWSPGGKRIRFARNGRYWEISANGENLHEFLPNWRATDPRYFMAGGRWTPNGDFFLFLGGVAGFSQDLSSARQLWILDERRSWPHRANSEPVRLTNETIWSDFVFSSDGSTIYCTGMNLRGELVRYEARSKELAPFLGGISAEYVSYSRDGKHMVYVTYPDGMMWRANRDGSGVQKLTGPPFHPIAPEWSPDGKQILFSELAPSRRGEIYLVSSQGGTPKRLLPANKSLARISDWSPDGKKIVFDQIPVGTHIVAYGIWVLQGEKSQFFDLDSGKFADLPPAPKPCFSPRWSPDGRYIVELATDHKSLLLLSLQTNEWSELDPKLSSMSFPRWSRDGRSIYVQDSDFAGVTTSKEPGIYKIPMSSGKAEKVVDLKGFRGTGSLTVGWSGLDPDDAPLLLRNVGTYDIYAMTLERK